MARIGRILLVYEEQSTLDEASDAANAAFANLAGFAGRTIGSQRLRAAPEAVASLDCAGITIVGTRRARGLIDDEATAIAIASRADLTNRGHAFECGAAAGSGSTCVVPRAIDAVITSCAFGLGRIGAKARGRITHAYVVALIERRARNRIASGASASAAAIRLRASIIVTTRGAIGLGRIGAKARGRFAYAHVVALVLRRARHWIAARARPCQTGIRLRAKIAVATCSAVRLVRIRANARGHIANAYVMALIERRARNGVGAGACTSQTCIRLRTSIAVITRRAVRLVRIGASARGRIANAYVMALIERRTRHRISTIACTGQTRVRLCASIAVIACCAVGLVRIRANPRRRIACAHIVALIERRARHRISTIACTGQTRVRLRARIAIIACCAVGLVRIRANPGRRIAGAHVMALVLRRAGNGISTIARTSLTRIRLGAGIVVITRRTVGLVRIRANPRRRIARPHVMALVLRRAGNGIAARTRAALATIRLCTCIVVITRRAIGLVRIRAHARFRIANAHVVALILGRTNDRIGPGAHARLTRIRLRTQARVITRRAIGFVRIRANARHRIARAHVVTLVLRRARDRICPRTSPRLARICLRTRIGIIACRAIGLVRIRANARHRIAYADVMALILCSTRDRRSCHTRASHTAIGLRTRIAIVTRTSVDLRRVRAQA